MTTWQHVVATVVGLEQGSGGFLGVGFVVGFVGAFSKKSVTREIYVWGMWGSSNLGVSMEWLCV